ncbi:YqgE/AlgH family protein [Catenovulum maritimum]|uniref:UPF0301 protein XM47_03980 n=1 Tax=Catenovulum maritimum TaxID=1513271 RepID=A0A0J8H058_9ALTE|nr:YqgE/AlgH family protein [Catenovulum maritimum]KMT66393.1 hypothetical protein XM47_03980 [Catenovulum maritimum]
MQSLKNHLLIAMPSLEDKYFERTVTYICEHDENGAMGIVINHPTDIILTELLEQIEIETTGKSINDKIPVYAGGPVNVERGFVIHSPKKGLKSSLKLSDDIMVTTSRDILESIGTSEEPENVLICLGYAGWDKDQLEEELLENTWITIPATAEILFNTPIHQRWQRATETLGFATWQISDSAGHA